MPLGLPDVLSEIWTSWGQHPNFQGAGLWVAYGVAQCLSARGRKGGQHCAEMAATIYDSKNLKIDNTISQVQVPLAKPDFLLRAQGPVCESLQTLLTFIKGRYAISFRNILLDSKAGIIRVFSYCPP